MVRASSLAFQLMVPPWVAITRMSNFDPLSLNADEIFFSVWRDGSAAKASRIVVLVRWVSLRTG